MDNEKGALIKARDALVTTNTVAFECRDNLTVATTGAALASLNAFINTTPEMEDIDHKIIENMQLTSSSAARGRIGKAAQHLHNGIKGKDNE